jgi:AraC-like DNA-binding protein
MADALGSTDRARFDGFDEWLDALSNVLVPLDVRAADARAFTGKLDSQTLGLLRANQVVAQPLVARRTPQMIRLSDPGHFKLSMPIDGSCILSQDGHEAILKEGDFAICDTTRPYDIAFDGDHEILVITMPREVLRLKPENLSKMTAHRIPADVGLGAVVSPFLRNLFDRMQRHDFTPSIQLADVVLDLLSASLAEQLNLLSTIEPEALHRARLLQVQTYIEQALGEPSLNLSRVAAAHHLSPRALQKIFQAQDLTVSGWIRGRRLERARKDLIDPQTAHPKIGAIASRWHLGPPTHFSRLFKEVYGCTPSEYRALNETSRICRTEVGRP